MICFNSSRIRLRFVQAWDKSQINRLLKANRGVLRFVSIRLSLNLDSYSTKIPSMPEEGFFLTHVGIYCRQSISACCDDEVPAV